MRRFAFSESLFLVLTLLLTACGGYGGGGNNGGGGGGGTAPGVPTGLTATAGNAQVSLAWTAVSGATTYNVKRGTAAGGPYTTKSSPSTASFNDTSVTNGTTYYYVVSAVNTYGESANTAEKSATPAAPAPSAPSGLTATAGNAQVGLSWTGVTGATSYKVKRGTVSGGPYNTNVGSPTATSITDSAVVNGTTYFYVVTAVTGAVESGNSNEKSATPTLPNPSAPNGFVAAAGNAQVVLNWLPTTNAASYTLKRGTVAGGPYGTTVGSPTATTITDSTAVNGTTYFYVVSATNGSGTSGNSAEASATPTLTPANVTITVNPASTHAISPWIYGINFFGGPNNSPPATMDRAGGNRWTAYNWENNFSNAGNDFGPYSNDTFLSSSTVPAEAVRSFIAADHTAGLASLVTVQLQGFVSADANGNVSVANPPDMSRFKTVVYKKSTVDATPFTITPPTTDGNVYMDEFLKALDQKFTGQGIFGASPALPTFVSLDNEPELWNGTHLEVQGPTMVTSDNYINKTINLSKALKDQFPNLTIFGPVHYGFAGIYRWQSELNPTPSGFDWFPDKYIRAISSASATYGKPLVDVYDLHWYPEVYNAGSARITSMSGTTLSASDVQQIVQAPRDLWDPTWHDPSNSNPWVYQTLGSTPIQILPRLQSKINAEFPSMKGIAITEYEGGGYNHIAGTIAEADMLGIFGVQNLFAASFWPPNGTYDYTLAGYRCFRGFDGANANFGDTSVEANSSDTSKVAVYVSTDSTTVGWDPLESTCRHASLSIL